MLPDSTYVLFVQAAAGPFAAQTAGRIGLSPDARTKSGHEGTVLQDAEQKPAELSMTAGVCLMSVFTHYVVRHSL